jgi:transcriptional regulator with XRE-family HTH domain
MKPIREKLPELRQAKKWSREQLSHEAYAIGRVGTSVSMIAGIERGTRRATPQTMIALAKALGEEPTVFGEYRLAIARHVLDETRVGLQQAIETLEASNLEPIDISEDEIKHHSHATRLADARDKEHAA